MNSFLEKPEKYIIGETYIKFDFVYNDDSINTIKNAYLSQVGKLPSESFKYSNEIKISIEFDEGSTKAKIVAWGMIIYLGIGNYGSFRTGIEHIVSDARQVSEFVVSHLKNDQRISDNNIVRYERRTGIPGRINAVYRRIDYLEKNLTNLSQNEVQNKIASIKQEISNITYILDPIELELFINELEAVYSNDLPEPDERRTNYLINRYGLKPNDHIELSF